MHPILNAGAHGGAAALRCNDFFSRSKLLEFDIPSRYAKIYFQPARFPIQGTCYLYGEQGTY